MILGIAIDRDLGEEVFDHDVKESDYLGRFYDQSGHRPVKKACNVALPITNWRLAGIGYSDKRICRDMSLRAGRRSDWR